MARFLDDKSLRLLKPFLRELHASHLESLGFELARRTRQVSRTRDGYREYFGLDVDWETSPEDYRGEFYILCGIEFVGPDIPPDMNSVNGSCHFAWTLAEVVRGAKVNFRLGRGSDRAALAGEVLHGVLGASARLARKARRLRARFLAGETELTSPKL